MGEIQDFASGVEYIARQVGEKLPRDITQKVELQLLYQQGSILF